MKILDTKEGKIFGINFIDFLVVLVVVFLLFSFGSKLLLKDLTFDGDEMYNAIQTYQRMDLKGFLVEAEIDGKWIADESDFKGSGVITEIRSGTFTIKNAKGEVLQIGGSMGYFEDVAASKIVLKPYENYVVPVVVNPMSFSSYSDFLKHFRGIADKLGSDNLKIGGAGAMFADVSFIGPKQSALEMFNDFNELYRVKYASIVQSKENETIFRLKLAELSELEKLNIQADKIIISKTVVYAGYKTKPNLGEEYRVASIEELL